LSAPLQIGNSFIIVEAPGVKTRFVFNETDGGKLGEMDNDVEDESRVEVECESRIEFEGPRESAGSAEAGSPSLPTVDINETFVLANTTSAGLYANEDV